MRLISLVSPNSRSVRAVSPAPVTPLAAVANEMMNASRGLGLDHNDFVVAHEVYRRLGGQSR